MKTKFDFSAALSKTAVIQSEVSIDLVKLQELNDILKSGEVEWLYFRLNQYTDIPTGNVTVITGIKERFEFPLNVELANALFETAITGKSTVNLPVSKYKPCEDENFVKDAIIAQREAGKKPDRKPENRLMDDILYMEFTTQFDFGVIEYRLKYSAELEKELRKKMVVNNQPEPDEINPDDVTESDLGI